MRVKLFFLFLCLAMLACMQEANEAGNAIVTPASISAKQVLPTIQPFSKPTNASKTPQATIYHASVTATDFLNIRMGPSVDYPTVGYAMHGEDVTVYECAGDWARIDAGRWVNSLYLSRQC